MQQDDPRLAYVLLYTDGACAGNPGPGDVYDRIAPVELPED